MSDSQLLINITGMNDAPIAIVDSVNVLANAGNTIGNVLANDSDPDGRPLSLVTVTAQDDSVVAEIVGDLVKTAGDITKSLAPLAQPFADVAAKALGKMLDQTFEPTQKSVDFSNTQEIGKRTLTF